MVKYPNLFRHRLMTGTSLGKYALNVPASWVYRHDVRNIFGFEIRDNGGRELVIRPAIIWDAIARRDRLMTRQEIRREHAKSPQSDLGRTVYVNRIHRMGHSQSKSFVVALPTEWVERQLGPNEIPPRFVMCDADMRMKLVIEFERPDETDEDAAEATLP